MGVARDTRKNVEKLAICLVKSDQDFLNPNKINGTMMAIKPKIPDNKLSLRSLPSSYPSNKLISAKSIPRLIN